MFCAAPFGIGMLLEIFLDTAGQDAWDIAVKVWLRGLGLMAPAGAALA